MGYKLAGFDHLGGVELDPKVAKIYETNHHPKYLYNMDIRDFNKLEDLPCELYNLDILDGSPPCSTFSIAGLREKAWGKEKKFKEGQKMQTLDDLIFVYAQTINKLQPKTFILENVKGLIIGNAKEYVKLVLKRLNKYGYDCQVFILDASRMGVPQARVRCFIIGRRRDLNLQPLVLNFYERPIYFKEVLDKEDTSCDLTEYMSTLWKKRKPTDNHVSDICKRIIGKPNNFNTALLKRERVCPTIVATNNHILFDIPRYLNIKELYKIGTFPSDYDYGNLGANWIIGMSVPPVMTAQISYQIYRQWLLKLRECE